MSTLDALFGLFNPVLVVLQAGEFCESKVGKRLLIQNRC